MFKGSLAVKTCSLVKRLEMRKKKKGTSEVSIVKYLVTVKKKGVDIRKKNPTS